MQNEKWSRYVLVYTSLLWHNVTHFPLLIWNCTWLTYKKITRIIIYTLRTYVHKLLCVYTHNTQVLMIICIHKIVQEIYEKINVSLAYHTIVITEGKRVVSSYKESRNNKPMYGYMLPNLSPSPNLYKVQSVYNNNVAS